MPLIGVLCPSLITLPPLAPSTPGRPAPNTAALSCSGFWTCCPRCLGAGFFKRPLQPTTFPQCPTCVLFLHNLYPKLHDVLSASCTRTVASGDQELVLCMVVTPASKTLSEKNRSAVYISWMEKLMNHLAKPVEPQFCGIEGIVTRLAILALTEYLIEMQIIRPHLGPTYWTRPSEGGTCSLGLNKLSR